MSLHELVGSVLMFGFRGSSLDDHETREDIDLLKAIHCAGVILFDHDIKANGPRNVRSPEQLKKLIHDLRHELGSNLMVAIDQEGGQVSRLKESLGFRSSVSAKAFAELEPMDQEQAASQLAKQLADFGIDLNFSPCVDLEIDPDCPIIACKERSFGSTPEQVLGCAHIVIEAHRKAQVACCVKHYPGHGSSMIDSHKGVCDITLTHTHDEYRIFGKLVDRFHDSIAIMSGHLMQLDIDADFPASLSHSHIKRRLRDDLNFDGVVVTDSLDMRAIRSAYGECESAVRAFSAGCDLILDGLNAPGYREPGAPRRIADAIGAAIRQGTLGLTEQMLIDSRERIGRLISR